jgi:MraZ protein
MFIGQFEHAIDQKNRIAVPVKFRRAISGGAVITKGLDGCIFLFTKEKFQKMAQSIGQLPLTRSSARLYARLILAGASDVEFDKQGRIILPGYLKEYAKIKRNATIVGVYDRVEIWDKGAWSKSIEKIENKAGGIAEGLSDLGV